VRAFDLNNLAISICNLFRLQHQIILQSIFIARIFMKFATCDKLYAPRSQLHIYSLNAVQSANERPSRHFGHFELEFTIYATYATTSLQRSPGIGRTRSSASSTKHAWSIQRSVTNYGMKQSRTSPSRFLVKQSVVFSHFLPLGQSFPCSVNSIFKSWHRFHYSFRQMSASLLLLFHFPGVVDEGCNPPCPELEGLLG
jgi:hypothetical protein